MKTLLGIGKGISARILATKLGLHYTSVSYRLTEPPVIRYGNSNGVFENDTEYNSPDSIRNCGNSAAFSKICADNKIRTPLYTLFDVNNNYTYPFLLRNAHHVAGKDIIIVESKEQLDTLITESAVDGRYHVPYIHTDLELGIHFINGKIIKIFKKIPGEKVLSERIRSSVMGWKYYLISDLEQFKVAQDLTLKTAELMGVKFGRADIGYNENDKKYYIFEINTAPGLNSKTAELYATVLREIIDV